jgi:hypothetical protein
VVLVVRDLTLHSPIEVKSWLVSWVGWSCNLDDALLSSFVLFNIPLEVVCLELLDLLSCWDILVLFSFKVTIFFD